MTNPYATPQPKARQRESSHSDIGSPLSLAVDCWAASSFPTRRLFDPPRQACSDHFHLRGYHIHGLTPIGRATVAVLDFNHLRRQHIRAAEEKLGLDPLEVR